MRVLNERPVTNTTAITKLVGESIKNESILWPLDIIKVVYQITDNPTG